MTLWQLIIISILISSSMSCKSQPEKVKESKSESLETDKLIGLEGDDLVHAVFQSIAEDIWIDNKVDMNYFSKLPTSKQVIYTTYLLEMEVNNGGFSQFHSNRGYEIAEDVPQFMELIGTPNHGQIVKDANNYMLNSKIESLEDNPLDELDKRFYKESQKKNILKLQAAYIKKNLNDFELK